MYLGTEWRNQLLKLVGSDHRAGKPDAIEAAGLSSPAEAEVGPKASEVLSFRSFAETRLQLHELQIDRIALERRNAELRLASHGKSSTIRLRSFLSQFLCEE